jgi:biotin synthase
MDLETILRWLREEDSEKLDQLWEAADRTRREQVGEEVHLRGLIEISNHCRRDCLYCGIRAQNANIERYRMTHEEIMECVAKAIEFGYGTIVLQAGEDPRLDQEWVTELIRRIRGESDLGVTLSLGERSEEELLAWREAGANRYLLRFETSNQALFHDIHPPLGEKQAPNRLVLLERLREYGYEVGSGVMVGIPGQSFEDLAHDIHLFGQLRLHMIGCGPFLPHPDTPLGRKSPETRSSSDSIGQVSATEKMALKVIALARLVCPESNIPSTTALATVHSTRGRELGLMRGANIIMPNLTPLEYRRKYEIYPNKASSRETAEETHRKILEQLSKMGRPAGRGRGDSPSYCKEQQNHTVSPGRSD